MRDRKNRGARPLARQANRTDAHEVLRYWLVIGRVPGDDEDSQMSFGPCDARTARAKFRDEMRADYDHERLALIRRHYGEDLYITGMWGSATPLRCEG